MCLLKLQSKKRSFKALAESGAFPVYSIREPKPGQKKVFRLSLDVSKKDWDDFEGQVKDAVTFLKKHRLALKRAFRVHDLSDAFLDFPIWSRLVGDIANQNDYLPRELVRLCGDIGLGIEMALYSPDAFDDSKRAIQRATDNDGAAPRRV